MPLVCAVAASTRQAWYYDSGGESVRVELLAPRGSFVELPSTVVWRANQTIAVLQFECHGRDGSRLTHRRVAVDAMAGAFALTNDERSAIATSDWAWCQVIAIDASGEWRGESAPPARSRRDSATPRG
ncbi:MAG: hypothetical protein EXS13_12335 [Planctomycetes bacterium]|nr:hypothetical protein [Planctomycetota bacterium]